VPDFKAGMGRIDSPSRVRQSLEASGIRPDKRLGQNFLCDGNWIRKAVATVPDGMPVVEIGPGLGGLTAELLANGHEVWAIETDERLCQHLHQFLSTDHFHLVHADAVSQPLAGILLNRKPFALLSNLPFAITSPWLDSLLNPNQSLPIFLALILQKEGMDRILAQPGDKTYGPTAIRLHLAFKPKKPSVVPRSAFHPQPGVESRFNTWTLLDSPRLLQPEATQLLRKFFGLRRKMIRQGMKQFLSEETNQRWIEVLAGSGLDGTSRAEQIPPDVWWNLLR